MVKRFKSDLVDPDKFVVTLELVPARESIGHRTDALEGITCDACKDGRISAVSITDNPGGNPALSPDVLGSEIFKQGMDVIVHFTCRDMNRVGMESRALQLARMGIKNILALTGDYSGKGFGGKGAPVFDLDSVLLTKMLKRLSEKIAASGDPDRFFTGCAVSPFKCRESECMAQYKKLDRKIEAGATFVITQLGYDIQKFEKLIRYHKEHNAYIPMIASIYLLSPRAARAMNKGLVPGAYVSDDLYEKVVSEWRIDPHNGLKQSIERAARLGVVLKGLGYRGIHIGGIHKSFDTVAAILDHMDAVEDRWADFLDESTAGCKEKSFYWYVKNTSGEKVEKDKPRLKEILLDRIPYRMMNFAHKLFFSKSSMLASALGGLASFLERHRQTWIIRWCLEEPVKGLMLSCQSCGDCAIQHVAFLCPESGCPKHTRNGPCGGSRDGACEVYPEKQCIWVRAYDRLKHANRISRFMADIVPPRMWELNKTSSWINFHLGKDHQR